MLVWPPPLLAVAASRAGACAGALSGGPDRRRARAQASMWIKVADSWLLALAYGWSMFAPVVCSGRDFS